MGWHFSEGQPHMPGQGCACGLADCHNRQPRPRHAAERTRSYRHRAGSRRWKRLSRTA